MHQRLWDLRRHFIGPIVAYVTSVCHERGRARGSLPQAPRSRRVISVLGRPIPAFGRGWKTPAMTTRLPSKADAQTPEAGGTFAADRASKAQFAWGLCRSSPPPWHRHPQRPCRPRPSPLTSRRTGPTSPGSRRAPLARGAAILRVNLRLDVTYRVVQPFLCIGNICP
jgi:hypothetical protein